MCSQNLNEVEVVRNELLKAGIASETRPHPVAAAMGVSGMELWVQNERDFFDASKLYARFLDHTPKGPGLKAGPKAKAAERADTRPGPQVQPSSPPPPQVSSAKSEPAVPPLHSDLKQAGSLLQKGIQEMLLRESELAGECASLRGKVEELTRALAKAQADVVREIERREVAEQKHAEQFTGVLNSLEQERREWQEQLKAREDASRKAQARIDALARLLQTQQDAGRVLRKKMAALETQREELERFCSDARKEATAAADACLAAEQRAAYAEESLQRELVERHALEEQLEKHLASIGSLLTREPSKAKTSGQL